MTSVAVLSNAARSSADGLFGGFGLIAPNYLSNSARPFSDALFTSNIGLGQVYDISSHNFTVYWTVVPATSTAGTVVFANSSSGT